MDFAGRAIVITGGASGMGAAAAELLCAGNARVAIVDWDLDLAHEVARRVGARAYGADIGDEAEVRRALEAIDREVGPIDGWFSNAGILRMEQPLHDERVETWDEVIRVNLRGTFLIVREAIRRFVAQRRPGAIVCTSSCVARQAIAGGSYAYTASKGAIEAFVRQVAVDYAAQGIRVNAIAPGAIETPLMWGNTPPAAMAATLAKLAGDEASPLLLSPHPTTVPSAFSARLWSPPAATAFTPAKSTGTLISP